MRHEHAVARTQPGCSAQVQSQGPATRLGSVWFGTFVMLTTVASLGACQGGGGSADQPAGGASGGASGGSGGSRNGGNGTPMGPSDPPTGSCDLKKGALPTTMRRLTAAEYDNAIADMVGDASQPASQTLAADEAVGGFAANSEVTVSAGDVEKLAAIARGTADRSVMRLGEVLACSNGQGEEACALGFIDRLGRRAYRRPLTGEERDQLVQLYRDKAKSDGHPQGVRLVIEAVLQMPQFLYRPVIGVGTSKPGINRLTGAELASRLSFYLWASVPDDELLTAAEKGTLDSVDGIKAQVDRMMKDARFDRTLESFSIQWLGLTDEPSKDSAEYPLFSPEVWRSAKSSVAKFFSHVVKDTDAKLATLLTEPVAFVDRGLAPVFGVSAPGDSLQKVATDPKTRKGILMHPAVLAQLAGPTESSPVRRGVFLRSRVLCQPPPPPPPDGVPSIPAPTTMSTQRQRLEEHRKNATCAACHSFFDPLGMAFEHYDGIGAWRDKEHNLAIDSSGTLNSTDVDGKFADAGQLVDMLKNSELVSECLSAQFFRYAVGRLESEGEACAIQAVSKSLSAQGYSVREAMTKLTTSDVFRFVAVP